MTLQKNTIDQNTLGRYVDELHQVEHNEMKQNYVETSVGRLSVTKSGCLRWNCSPVIRIYLRWFIFHQNFLL